MRHYELVTILSPMLSQDQAGEAWGQINDFITNRNGDIFQEQPWGTRRLAYPIHQGAHHFLEGNYRLIRFSTETPFNQALETFLKFDERVLRSLVIAIPEREMLPDPVAARPAPAPAAPAPAAEAGEATPAPAPAAEAGEAAPPAAEAVPAETTETPAEATAEAAPAETAEAAAEPTPAAEVTETEAPVAESEATPEAEAESAPATEPEAAPESPASEEPSQA